MKLEQRLWVDTIGVWDIVGFRDGFASGMGYKGKVSYSDFAYGDFAPCSERFGGLSRWDQGKAKGKTKIKVVMVFNYFLIYKKII